MENNVLKLVKEETEYFNRDNLTRTYAYKQYYRRNSEITWAYLASMVSRNAGWSMSDLWSKPYKELLTMKDREHLFISYERANWMIFSDAFPQLIIYEYSKKLGKNLFTLLYHFNVSEWMINQWEDYWENREGTKLLHALIINEQHLIQEPVIESPFFYSNVFGRIDYHIQERLHFSVVLFPTFDGDIYGRSIKKFNDVEWRIDLGKKLGWILLHSKEKVRIHNFFINSKFTGSRIDYQLFQKENFSKTPKLKPIYPYVFHGDEKRRDWSNLNRYNPDRLLKMKDKPPKGYNLSHWYQDKQHQVAIVASLYNIVSNIIKKDK